MTKAVPTYPMITLVYLVASHSIVWRGSKDG